MFERDLEGPRTDRNLPPTFWYSRRYEHCVAKRKGRHKDSEVESDQLSDSPLIAISLSSIRIERVKTNGRGPPTSPALRLRVLTPRNRFAHRGGGRGQRLCTSWYPTQSTGVLRYALIPRLESRFCQCSSNLLQIGDAAKFTLPLGDSKREDSFGLFHCLRNLLGGWAAESVFVSCVVECWRFADRLCERFSFRLASLILELISQ